MTNNAEREGFVRGERYVVLKIRDVKDGLSSIQIEQLKSICKAVEQYRKTTNRIPLVCVVVESDWPEYEPVWAMIEARMTGQARAQASGVPDEQAAYLVEETAKILSGAPFPSARSYAKAREIADLFLTHSAPTTSKSASVPVERLEVMQRYRMDAWGAPATPCAQEEEDSNGEWIRHADITKLIAEYKS